MKYTCETCNRDAGRAGVTCDPCTRARLRRLLESIAWRTVAHSRTGDHPGESMLDTIQREYDALTR